MDLKKIVELVSKTSGLIAEVIAWLFIFHLSFIGALFHTFVVRDDGRSSEGIFANFFDVLLLGALNPIFSVSVLIIAGFLTKNLRKSLLIWLVYLTLHMSFFLGVVILGPLIF